MSDQYTNEPMLDMFIFETSQLIEHLEQSILTSEKSSCYTEAAINEIFRIMHTIKGSSAMMMFNNISTLAHSIEDLFYFLREEKPHQVNCSALSDLVLEGVDLIKVEVEKIKNGDIADRN
jgi:two-component system chemotaxis sensor kinase CheA